MDNLALFELIIGDAPSEATVSAVNADAAEYITLRNAGLDAHWTFYQDGQYYNGVLSPHHLDMGVPANGTEWVNFYDRVYLYYHKYKASGYVDTTSRDRARAIVAYYMTDITNGFTNWGVEPLYDAPVGVALYYADTGSSNALTFLSTTSAKWRSAAWLQKIGSTVQTPNGFDGRTTGRGMTTLITAWLCGAPQIDHPDWGPPLVPISQENAIRQAMNQILAGVDSDGIWRYASYDGTGAAPWDGYPAPYTHWGGSGRVAKPWMIGLILESMIYYDQMFESDPRIAAAIQTACEYMWSGDGTTPSQHGATTLSGLTGVANTHLFDRTRKNFYYIEGGSPDEQIPASWYLPPLWPDAVISVSLNGLLMNAFAYIYSKTADTTWRDRALDILSGIVMVAQSTFENSAFTSSKLVNENFVWSYKTFSLLAAEPAEPSLMCWQVALRCRP